MINSLWISCDFRRCSKDQKCQYETETPLLQSAKRGLAIVVSNIVGFLDKKSLRSALAPASIFRFANRVRIFFRWNAALLAYSPL